MKPPKQDRFSRYARYASSQPFPWIAVLALAEKHAPTGLKQWMADNIMCKIIEGEYSK